MSISRVTDRYCLHPSEARQAGVDVDDQWFETCEECGDLWLLGKVSRQRAAAIRRAVAWDLHVRRVANGEDTTQEPHLWREGGSETK